MGIENEIRLRACLAVMREHRILLVPHFDIGGTPVEWNIPGGRVEFGERVEEAAVREFLEETGLRATIVGLLDVSEVLITDRPYHSITITYIGQVAGGQLSSEVDHPYGEKMPRWFSAEELKSLRYHPKVAVEKALDLTDL